MKYIVTGATGHVGGNIVRYLLGKNQEVKIAVRNINDKSIKDWTIIIWYNQAVLSRIIFCLVLFFNICFNMEKFEYL